MLSLSFLRFIFFLPCLAFPWAIAKGDTANIHIARTPVFLMPNGEGVLLETILEPLPQADSLRLRVKNIGYERVILRTIDGAERTIYRSPSSPYAESVDYHHDEITALMADDKVELLRTSNGLITLMRFQRNNNDWRFVAKAHFGDFFSFQLAPDSAEKSELIDWGTVRLKIRDGSFRTLTIDQDGVFRENGVVHKLTRQNKAPGVTDEQHYKTSYDESHAEYYEPRDTNGIPLHLVEHLLKVRHKASAQPSNPNEAVESAGVPKSAARTSDKRPVDQQAEPASPKDNGAGQIRSWLALFACGVLVISAIGLLCWLSRNGTD